MSGKGFPNGFLWGTAISGFQAEMGLSSEDIDSNTDWFLWVHDQENIKKGIVSGDFPEDGPGLLRRYRDDFGLVRNRLANNAIRLSLEWSRIFPEPTSDIPVKISQDRFGNIHSVQVPPKSMKLLQDKADQGAVKRYRDMLKEAIELKLTIVLTLNHFTLPLWLHGPTLCRNSFKRSDRRGWVEPKIIVEFAKYAAYSAKTFGDIVDIWATINEPMVVSILGYLLPFPLPFPPGKSDIGLCLTASRNLAMAHAIAYQQVKKWDKKSISPFGPAYVGVVVNPQVYDAYDKHSKEDQQAANFYSYFWNEWYLNAVLHGEYDLNLNMRIEPEEWLPHLAKGCDYIGVNYYTRYRVKASSATPLKGEVIPCEENCTDMGWEIYPEGIRDVLDWVYTKYRRPIILTENGIADERDEKRSVFLQRNLEETYKAITQDRVPVQGYFHWSLTDNFEWANGFTKRFGLFKVDCASKERRPSKAVELYKQICSQNAL